jgi:hypothetical protein
MKPFAAGAAPLDKAMGLDKAMRMARFYFNVRGGQAEVHDDFGRNLPDLEAARREAVLVARIMASGEVIDGRTPLQEWIDVEDAERRPVFALPFRVALRF